MSTPLVPARAAERRSDDAPWGGPERLALASRIAQLIGGYRGRESLVVAIEGPWGAGKVAFTGLVLKEIEGRRAATLLPFNPWSLSEQSELVAEFFLALSGALGREGGEAQPKMPVSYGARLRATAMRSLHLSARASVGLTRALVRKPRTVHEERGDISEKLGRLTGRILVVIDDFDRLDHAQTKLVMRLVRIASGLPNLVFLLAYDRHRVSASVEEAGRPGEDMLKTLVHVAFTLPEPSRQELNGALYGALRDTVSRVYNGARVADDDERWRELVLAELPPLFRTLAEVTGFASSLRLAWTVVGTDAVNMVDFVGIEAIRFFAPHLYAAMAMNRTLFLGPLSGRYPNGRDEASERSSRYEDVLRAAPDDRRACIDAICRYLFPQLAGDRDTSEWQDDWRHDRRVCAEAAFRVYFQLGIPDPTVSETEVLFLRRRFESPAAVTDLLRQYLGDGRLVPLLMQLISKSSIVSEADARAVLLGLWELEEALEGTEAVTHETDGVRPLAVQLARNLLRDAVDAGNRERFLDDLITATRATSLPAALLSALEQQLDIAGEESEETLLTRASLAPVRARLAGRLPQPGSRPAKV